MSRLTTTVRIERYREESSLFAPLAVPPPRISTRKARELGESLFGIRARAVHALNGDRDKNFELVTADGDTYLLKVGSAAEDFSATDMQNQLLRHLSRKRLGVAVPSLFASLSGTPVERVELDDGRVHNIRMMSYLPGAPVANAVPSSQLFQNLGQCLARLDRGLDDFDHRAASDPAPWNMVHAESLLELLAYVGDRSQRETLQALLRNFDRNILPEVPKLRAQVIHNDFNPHNVLFDPESPGQLSGIIDFGDVVRSPLVFEVGIAATYQLLEEDPVTAVVELVRGYNATVPLEPVELHMLHDVIGVRLATWAVLAQWRAAACPDRKDHFLRNQDRLWGVIARHTASSHETTRRLESIERDSREVLRAQAVPRSEVAQRLRDDNLAMRRSHVVGDALPLLYDEPLHLVRGDGVWVYDVAGKAYLDAYNNVAHVGHCHPHVVAALCRQASILNTNTRYLDEHLVDYAERLIGMFPEGLDVCLFTCSGSEANDLALRLARAFTRGNRLIVTKNAYHGSTDATQRVSTSRAGNRAHASIETINAPRRRRTDPGESFVNGLVDYADEVHVAVREIASTGNGLLGLMLDPMFSSDGIVDAPEGYLAKAVEHVRRAGGLFIADEIQAGFGRIGTHTWSFAAHGVTPDIVTLGKAIGNGHPMAAVVTRSEILQAFRNEGPYMNTFAGNPVSCAVGGAVLDVLENERLEENARVVGEHLRESLLDLRSRHAFIGDVRGSGLMIGVELVTDRRIGLPASNVARAVVEEMRRRGVLVGLTGPRRNVIKVRPPLVFRREHANIVAMQLDETLAELASVSAAS